MMCGYCVAETISGRFGGADGVSIAVSVGCGCDSEVVGGRNRRASCLSVLVPMCGCSVAVVVGC